MASKYYIIAEATSTSGGPETLHQFAQRLGEYGCDVYIYYIDCVGASVPEKFIKYNVKTTVTIEDKEENVLIVPESYTDFLFDYKRIQKSIMWLSLDFYLLTLPWNRTIDTCKRYKIPVLFAPFMYGLLNFSKRLRHKVYRFKQKEGDIFHLYNCEYIREYLVKNNVDQNKMLYLCGPLRDEYFEQVIELDKKENIIVYNPKKGLDFTSKLISECEKITKEYCFIPIKDMTPAQIVDLLKKAKLYIDFGYFPGPERIPREAAMMMCNIITSNIGSASNSQDVLVPYKYEPHKKSVQDILSMINELVLNYEKHICEYDDYRKKVIKQRDLFYINCGKFVEYYRNKGDNK